MQVLLQLKSDQKLCVGVRYGSSRGLFQMQPPGGTEENNQQTELWCRVKVLGLNWAASEYKCGTLLFHNLEETEEDHINKTRNL